MDLQSVTLLSFGNFERTFLKKIAENIHHELFFNIHIKECHLDLSDFYNAARRQYNANSILQEIEKKYSTDDMKSIGLFNVDFFIPIFTYIFGQAYLGGRMGIASIFRLCNERYGIEADEELLHERFSKVIIHELGHTLGLVHCYVPDCVMRSGTYVEDLDQKGLSLCNGCRDLLTNV